MTGINITLQSIYIYRHKYINNVRQICCILAAASEDHLVLFFTMNLAEGEPRYPDSLRVSSSGPVSDLLPSYLGDYQKTSNISSCDRPVWQHTERQDRFILYRGTPKDSRE